MIRRRINNISAFSLNATSGQGLTIRRRINNERRQRGIAAMNKADIQPLLRGGLLLLAFIGSCFFICRRRERAKAL